MEIYLDNAATTTVHPDVIKTITETMIHVSGNPSSIHSIGLGAKEILDNDKGILIENRNEDLMIKNLNDLMDDIKLRKKYQKKSIEISGNYNYANIEESNLNFYKNRFSFRPRYKYANEHISIYGRMAFIMALKKKKGAENK